MAVPKLFQSKTSILTDVVGAEVVAQPPIGGAPQSKSLNLVMQSQQQTNWCWTAVGTSVGLFYEPQQVWTQCQLVNGEFNLTSCCQDGSTAACNKPWRLERALSWVGHYQGNASGSAAFTSVKNHIDQDRPVGGFIRWKGGGVGHFVVIKGYREQNGLQRVEVEDPFYGSSVYTFDDFRLRYQNATGAWTWTYFTR